MSGVIGVNVRTLGVNRDNILAAALTLGGRYILVQDDPELAAQAASAGLKVIYRQSGDETLHLNPATFVAERAKNAPAAAYIHLTNELDPTPELLAWTMEAMRYADNIKRKVCIFNFSTHRSTAQWGACGSLVQRAVTTGHAVGLHVYLDGRHDDGAFSWQSLKRAAGGQWLVTEFAFIRDVADAYAGWRGTLNEQDYADFCRAWLPTFAAEGMPALLFSYDHWTHNEEGKAHGFGVNDAPNLLNALAVLNARYPIVEGTPVQNGIPMTVNAPAGLKLRATPNGDPVLYVMPFGTRVTGYPSTAQRAGAYAWIQVDDDGTRGWAAQVYLTPETTPTPQPAFRLKNPVGCAHIISSKFGVPRDYDGDGVLDDIHEGLDITRAHGDCTPLILNGADGVVMDVSTVGDYGNHVKVSSVVGGQEFIVWYCHMAQMFVVKGQQVKAGSPIGVMGSTGNSTGLHLHLNCQKVGAPTPVGSPLASVVNPELYIDW